MDDLVRWLRAQLDEANTDLHTVECGWHQREFGHEGTDCTCGAPERLRAEVDAKRQMLECCEWNNEGDREEFSDYQAGRAQASRHFVRLLALPYADRPGYREEWKP